MNKQLKMATISALELIKLYKENNIKDFSKMSKELRLITVIENGVDVRSHLEIKERKETNPEPEKSKAKKKETSGGKKEKSETEEKKPRAKKEKPEFEQSDMIKSKKECYVFKDDKSDKFWNIIYERSDNEKQKYIIQYGKVGSSGTETKNIETLEKIQKLIQEKIKKGYVKQ